MLGVIAWFVIGTYNRIDKIEEAGQQNMSAIVEAQTNLKHLQVLVNQHTQRIDNIIERTTTLHAPANRRN